jgi:hypothetical protein
VEHISRECLLIAVISIGVLNNLQLYILNCTVEAPFKVCLGDGGYLKVAQRIILQCSDEVSALI